MNSLYNYKMSKKILNSDYIFTKDGISVSVLIDYERKKYSITECEEGMSQEGVFWGDRTDVAADSIKSALICFEVMPFVTRKLKSKAKDEKTD